MNEPEIVVFADQAAAADEAAARIATALADAVASRARADWVTTGGSALVARYQRLAAEPLVDAASRNNDRFLMERIQVGLGEFVVDDCADAAPERLNIFHRGIDGQRVLVVPAAGVAEPALDCLLIDAGSVEERAGARRRGVGEAPARLDAGYREVFHHPSRRFEVDRLKFDAAPRSGLAHLRLSLATEQAGECEEQGYRDEGWAHAGGRWKREAGLRQVTSA